MASGEKQAKYAAVSVAANAATRSSVAVITWSLVSVAMPIPGSLKVLMMWCASLYGRGHTPASSSFVTPMECITICQNSPEIAYKNSDIRLF